jgi:hypothetical protein
MTMCATDFGAPVGKKDLAHPNGGSFGWWGWGTRPGGFYNWAQLYTTTEIWMHPIWNAYYLAGDNHIRRIRNYSEAVMEVELFPCFGGWPGLGGNTFDEYGGNPRHGGTPVKGGKWGSVLYMDGHAVGSSRFGPYIPWLYMCFTRSPDAPGWPGSEPYQP